MTRKECLDDAAKCVLQDRACEYGGMEDNFGRIAKLWTHYLGVAVDAVDVAMCMALLKVARIRNNKAHADSYVDLAGYAACGAECAQMSAPQLSGGEFKLWGHKSKADTQLKYRPGDKVLALSFDGTRWEEAVVERTELANTGWHCTVKLPSGERHCLPVANIRPAPKAEGCEELVRKNAVFDSPRTPQELYQRIVDCNPAAFKPRTPTGEELAEMAREDGDGA